MMYPAKFLGQTFVRKAIGQTIKHGSHQPLAESERHHAVHVDVTVANIAVEACEEFVAAVTTQNNFYMFGCQPCRLEHTGSDWIGWLIHMPDHFRQGLDQVGCDAFLNMVRMIVFSHYACIRSFIEVTFFDADRKGLGLQAQVTRQDCNDHARIQTTAEERTYRHIAKEMGVYGTFDLFLKSFDDFGFG